VEPEWHLLLDVVVEVDVAVEVVEVEVEVVEAAEPYQEKATYLRLMTDIFICYIFFCIID
jgi:hypothetical protein